MKGSLITALTCLLFVTAQAQITCSPEDSLLFKSKVETLQELSLTPDAPSMVSIGKTFLGTPYVEKTLEIGEEETLVVNLRGLDCTTFVENVLAFSMLMREKTYTFENFIANLKTIRYRDGILNGYPSRLHYFTEWILNNNEKGLVKDITADLGGVSFTKPINFMGTHRDLYPFLADDANYEALLAVEANLAKHTRCVVPQESIAGIEEKLENGDIIALATDITGLDVTHTGIAIRMPSGRIHLLHASISGEVTITKTPLVTYLKKIKRNTGIVVARPL